MGFLQGLLHWLACRFARRAPERPEPKRKASLGAGKSKAKTPGNVRAIVQQLVKNERELTVNSLSGLAVVFRLGAMEHASELLAHAWVQGDRLDELELAYEDERGDDRFEDWCDASLGVDRRCRRFYRATTKRFPTVDSLPGFLTEGDVRNILLMAKGDKAPELLASVARHDMDGSL